MPSSYYDPLINSTPASQPFADSYWASTQSLPALLPSLKSSQQTDVAIIGGGYTGLLTAYYLATEFNIDCRVLEANQVGFGASARNAGFVLKGSGRLGYSAMAKRWDLATAQGIYQEFSQAVSRVEGLINQHQIACEPQEHGYLKVAHNPKALNSLKAAADFIQQNMAQDSDFTAQFISADKFKTQYLNHHQAYGALRLNDGFGVNPLKLLLGYKSLVQKQGVSINEQSCVVDWIEENGKHRLLTEHGELLANKVIMAGNAYSPKQFNQRVDDKFLPILSNIIVTEPLTDDELAQAGLHTNQVTMDTRILKYYFRLLPDNRLLFGGRGAVWGKDAAEPIYGQRLKLAMDKCFPYLSRKKIAYNWTGWIAASMDDMPHVYSKNGVGYSLGYCGAGVSFSAQAAFRLAQSIAGESLPDLPLYNAPLPAMPFTKARRIGQWSYYHYGWLKDKFG
ncbi:FAD-binding oxidoreductase [Shewanella sp. 1_MG-2023]|uniref:NAD(P)/FAD-dependent oxidoreductase n=1 Tax=unclassified Shewanella TaxID=196818 RepID=UPI0026E3244F|nr:MULTISPECIES: FAD-binding oxidoreductase [unclassified Shewanella]MDO6612638.1 FAD-binding oxidoreductase [Shewanella sp. 7_MG-2023]MDO6772337.1 FAD-binding oxidoreductase [Shewanella sp. 2_MG-2023]MDO6795320.1 FAD-binding oxidoreductase [Shewanella sp. 1_MG-2023]